MIRVDGLSAGYGDTPIIEDISFTVESATITGLIGPNGSGKSTLLRAMAGILPYQGAVAFDDLPLASMTRQQRVHALSYVAQHTGQSLNLTVGEVVQLGRQAGRGPLAGAQPDDERIVQSALNQSGLEELQHRKMSELSGGQVQRAMVARAMAQRSANMLLDEPTNHLDLRHQYKLLGVLSELRSYQKTAVVLAIHDLELAARYCDQLVVVDRGRIVAQGSPQQTLSPALLAEVFGVSGEYTSTASGIPVLAVRGPLSSAQDSMLPARNGQTDAP